MGISDRAGRRGAELCPAFRPGSTARRTATGQARRGASGNPRPRHPVNSARGRNGAWRRQRPAAL